ncbi:MAG: S41 family peptidase [Phycisphaerales bacterium]
MHIARSPLDPDTRVTVPCPSDSGACGSRRTRESHRPEPPIEQPPRPARGARGLIALLLGASVALGAGAPMARGAEGDLPEAYRTVAQWSNSVWASMTGVDGGASTLQLLEAVPDQQVRSIGLNPLGDSIALAMENSTKWETKRLERIEVLRTEMSERIEGGKNIEALRSANELLELSHDRDAVLADPMVVRLAKAASEEARASEADEQWLHALELFSRLHMLYDIEDTYRDDVRRTAQRLQMLRSYVPERLWEMQNAELVAQGDDPLPPFNDLGEDWTKNFAGINADMVARSMLIASQQHVESAQPNRQHMLADLLLGGLAAVRTMATTTDLADEFPSLNDADRRGRFIDYIDQVAKDVTENPRSINLSRMFRSIDLLQSVSNESVKIPSNALMHEFGNGAMSVLDDYTSILWPKELLDIQKTTQGKFTGVGIQITLDDARRLKVVTPLQGTPASKAGIRSGDIISEVEGEPTLGITLNQAVDRITGPKGSPVMLTIERETEDEPFQVTLVRDEIPIHSVKGWDRNGPGEEDWDWFIDPDNGIGYIRLTQFTNNTTRDMHAALREMRSEGLKGLILDLRWNPGGLLEEAVRVSNTFIATDGVLVSQEDAQGRQGDVQRGSLVRSLVTDIPMFVLVNEGSASASEIVAGALQDYDRAVIVGQRTFGKGSVQVLFPLGRGEAMFKITTQYYRLPDGRLIHRRPGATQWGVEPNVSVSMLPEQVAGSLRTRQDADVLPMDENGVPMLDSPERVDPGKLLVEGLDPQLQTALVLMQSKIAVEEAVAAAMR